MTVIRHDRHKNRSRRFPPSTEPLDKSYAVEFRVPLTYRYGRHMAGWVPAAYWNVDDAVLSRKGVLSVTPTVRRSKTSGLTSPTARTLHYEKWVPGVYSRRIYINSGWDYYETVSPDQLPLIHGFNRHFLDPYPSDPEDEVLRTEAILDAMSALKDQRWNAGVMIAESEGVAKMAVDLLELIADTRKKLRKGDFRRAYRNFRRKTNYMSYPAWKQKYYQQIRRDRTVRTAGKIPQSWLYYHFGIKPTIDDITSICDDFDRRKTDTAFGRGGVVHGYARKTTKKRGAVLQYAHPQGYNGIEDLTIVRSLRVAIGVTPRQEMLSRLSSLGVTNPPEAVYNRIPFSWFIDYFTSFGEWLGALDAGMGWTFADKWTESWRTVARLEFTPVTGYAHIYSYPVQAGVLEMKDLKRNVISTTYGPMGSVLPQRLRKGPSAKRIANALSVAAQLFR